MRWRTQRWRSVYHVRRRRIVANDDFVIRSRVYRIAIGDSRLSTPPSRSRSETCGRPDAKTRHATLRGADVHLTPIEYRLLTSLIRKAGQVVTQAELLRDTWGPGKTDQPHYLRIYMAGLRRKLEDDSAQPVYLLTETGVGYRIVEE